MQGRKPRPASGLGTLHPMPAPATGLNTTNSTTANDRAKINDSTCSNHGLPSSGRKWSDSRDEAEAGTPHHRTLNRRRSRRRSQNQIPRAAWRQYASANHSAAPKTSPDGALLTKPLDPVEKVKCKATSTPSSARTGGAGTSTTAASKDRTSSPASELQFAVKNRVHVRQLTLISS